MVCCRCSLEMEVGAREEERESCQVVESLQGGVSWRMLSPFCDLVVYLVFNPARGVLGSRCGRFKSWSGGAESGYRRCLLESLGLLQGMYCIVVHAHSIAGLGWAQG